LIEELIRSGHLRKLIEKAAQRHEERSDTTKVPRSPDTEEDKGKDTVRITVNTTAEGFAGGAGPVPQESDTSADQVERHI
jgi:hypothetical protein